MKNLFVPTGEVVYLGTDTELANEIYNLNGKIENDGDYRCIVSVPKRKREMGFSIGVVKCSRMCFRLCGKITPFTEGYKITYSVYPTFGTALFLLVPLYVFLNVFIGWSGNLRQLVGALFEPVILSAILISVFLIFRHFAIRQFVKRFQDDWVSDEGIF